MDHLLPIGTKVRKNPATWESNDFDAWRGEGIGVVVDPPFPVADIGAVDVRWPPPHGGRYIEPVAGLLVVCPSCDGRRSGPTFVDGIRADGSRFGEVRDLPCPLCRGEGTITPEHARRLAEGRARAEDRKRRLLTLREEAARLGITPKELSDIEWGRV